MSEQVPANQGQGSGSAIKKDPTSTVFKVSLLEFRTAFSMIFLSKITEYVNVSYLTPQNIGRMVYNPTTITSVANSALTQFSEENDQHVTVKGME